jgi:hypothetical protein
MLLVLTLAISAVVAQGQSSAWKTYSYAADGFSISAPSEPTFDKQEIKGELATTEMHSYIVDMKEAGVLFTSTTDASAAVKVKTSQQILDDAAQGAMENVKSQLVHKSNITLGGNPGVNFESKNEAQYFTARIYVVGNTLYVNVVVTTLTQPYAETARFLDSFRLIPRSQ